MPLTMRPAGLSSGINPVRADYTVFCGEWNIGRIYEVRGGSEHLRWFWALHFPSKPESLRTDKLYENLLEMLPGNVSKRGRNQCLPWLALFLEAKLDLSAMPR
jgi:hypothetical protein